MECRETQGRIRALEGNVGGEAPKDSGEERLVLYDMTVELPDDDLELIIKALDHYHAYTAPGTTSLLAAHACFQEVWYLE